VDDLADLERVVVDKSDRKVVPLWVVAELTEHHLAAVARTIDQHTPPLAGGGRRKNLAYKPKGEAAADKCKEKNDGVEDKYRSGKILKPVKQQYGNDAECRAEQYALAESYEIAHARVPPQAAIDTDHQKGEKL